MSAQGYRRQSWEILQELAKYITAKAIAYAMRLNISLVYEWIKDPETVEEMMNAGKRNPLDRAGEILHLMASNGHRDLALEALNWLAAEAGALVLLDEEVDALGKPLEEAKARARGKRREA